MLNDRTRIKCGDMEAELSADVDELIDEFMAIVEGMADERHLQRGIARSQLPCSTVAILDKRNLSILAQLRRENRTAGYYFRPDIALTPQQAANIAMWEFGFNDPFIIQFPAELMKESAEQRAAALRTIAASHIDSEIIRLQQMLSLMRMRPIFGQATQPPAARNLFLLLPQDARLRANEKAISGACLANNLAFEEAYDIMVGRSAVRELWNGLNHAAVVVADLTGADGGVMYGLGIAHTLGKETILIHPQGSKYLRDIPRTHGIEYEDSDVGRTRLEEQLSLMLGAMLAPIVEE